MLLLYILWDDWPIFMISGSNQLLWISKMQSVREDTLEERYAINSVLNLEKMPQFLSGIRDSRKAGMMRGVGGVRKSIHKSWLAKGLGLRLLCWGLRRVLLEIPREVASTLQIGSVAFPAGQCTSPQLHPCHRLFDQDRHQDSSSPSL